jgi:hypothetical protein
MADNVNHYEEGHTGAPRRGAALLQGIAICGRCLFWRAADQTGVAGFGPRMVCINPLLITEVISASFGLSPRANAS